MIIGKIAGRHVTVRQLVALLERGYSFAYVAATDTLIVRRG